MDKPFMTAAPFVLACFIRAVWAGLYTKSMTKCAGVRNSKGNSMDASTFGKVPMGVQFTKTLQAFSICALISAYV